MRHLFLFLTLLLSATPATAQHKLSFVASPVSSTSLAASSVGSLPRHAVCPAREDTLSGGEGWGVASKSAALENDEWLGSDKVKHFGVSFTLALGLRVAASHALKFEKPAAVAFAAGTTLLVGFAKEIVDDADERNLFSLKDLAADALGILTAVALGALF